MKFYIYGLLLIIAGFTCLESKPQGVVKKGFIVLDNGDSLHG